MLKKKKKKERKKERKKKESDAAASLLSSIATARPSSQTLSEVIFDFMIGKPLGKQILFFNNSGSKWGLDQMCFAKPG